MLLEYREAIAQCKESLNRWIYAERHAFRLLMINPCLVRVFEQTIETEFQKRHPGDPLRFSDFEKNNKERVIYEELIEPLLGRPWKWYSWKNYPSPRRLFRAFQLDRDEHTRDPIVRDKWRNVLEQPQPSFH